MKKNYRIVLSMLMCLFAVGCHKTEVKQVSEEASAPVESEPEKSIETTAYNELLSDLYYMVLSGRIEEEDPVWAAELTYISDGNPLELVGYTISDIDQNGVEELLISEVNANQTPVTLALYTLVNGQPVQVFDSWYRSSFTWMGENHFVFSGSESAFYHIYGTYDYSEGAMKSREFYYTYADDNDFEVTHYYKGRTNCIDPANDELLDVDGAGFEQLYEDMCTDFMPEYTLFTQFVPVKAPEAWVCARMEYDPESEMTGLTENFASMIRLVSLGEVTNLKLYKASIKDVTEDGSLTMDMTELWNIDVLHAGESAGFGVTFMGDSIEWMCSYTDPEGMEHYCSLTLSGEDGSLLINEETLN